ncbi:MAG: adaptor protein MecA [Lachnospiraceae bacterium]|jgi:adapter protein MecA 1/2|nr:adaptor protein MecA [Lachnospiraceae bacterium]MCI6665826.1 adaptor protein MecA [Lachnospiraceae bacterium]MCI6977239.1 adaptor protein MecA [Lachnospiraceae bacterium]MDD7223521.1 adaptor protein MecA [Lachnospiraceae bacterium]MDY3255301.1 adaptor protein MecA [Lachnospiraceae bacterium]
MKLERVNDHQIRCTLTRADLAQRELKISELAYGSDKAKKLFRDMMQKATYELGFEAEDTPLMIEAVPVSADSIILIITKVEDPEELDTRFANFAPSVHESSESSSPIEQLIQSLSSDAENVLDLFKKYRQATNNDEAVASDNTIKEASQGFEITKIFSFEKLSDVISVAKLLSKFYAGENALYKSKKSGKLILVIHKSHHTPEDFNKVCNIISEYGVAEKYTEAYASYLEENGDTIIGEHALLTLAVV